MNVICVVLKIVIHTSGERVHAIRDHVINLNLKLLLCQIEMESISQRAHNTSTVALLKTGHLRAQLHDLHNGHELVHVFARGQESAQHQNLEVGEHVALDAAHHLGELVRHLEGGWLEAQVLGRTRQHEAVVDVDEVAVVVEEYVAVVAILDLEQVAGDRVAGAGGHEVLLGVQEGLAGARAKLGQEEVEQRVHCWGRAVAVAAAVAAGRVSRRVVAGTGGGVAGLSTRGEK